jgi:hypothetical protein
MRAMVHRDWRAYKHDKYDGEADEGEGTRGSAKKKCWPRLEFALFGATRGRGKIGFENRGWRLESSGGENSSSALKFAIPRYSAEKVITCLLS